MRKKQLAVLAALAAAPNQRLHLMDIFDRTGLLPGTTWPIMVQFENRGLVCVSWEVVASTETRPRRRRYTITTRGVCVARTATGINGRSGAGWRWRTRRFFGWCQEAVGASFGSVAR